MNSLFIEIKGGIARALQICISTTFLVTGFSNSTNNLLKKLKSVIWRVKRVFNRSIEPFGIQILIQKGFY